MPGFPDLNFSAHSHYYDVGNEALHSMADIASGHGDALGADGVLADPRHRPEVKVDLPWLGPVTIEEPAWPIGNFTAASTRTAGLAIGRYGRLPGGGQSPTAPVPGSTSPSDVCWLFKGSECRFGKGPVVRQCDSLLPEVHDQLAPLVA